MLCDTSAHIPSVKASHMTELSKGQDNTSYPLWEATTKVHGKDHLKGGGKEWPQ